MQQPTVQEMIQRMMDAGIQRPTNSSVNASEVGRAKIIGQIPMGGGQAGGQLAGQPSGQRGMGGLGGSGRGLNLPPAASKRVLPGNEPAAPAQSSDDGGGGFGQLAGLFGGLPGLLAGDGGMSGLFGGLAGLLSK